VIDERRLMRLERRLDLVSVIDLVDADTPAVVGIDGPRCCAPAGRSARDGERELARRICGIRWTPDRSTVESNAYYAWIVEGLHLFDALGAHASEVVEVFPIASWTRWFGLRGASTRADWTQRGLTRLGLAGIPTRTNQDQRDAIAAAVTARQHSEGATEAIGEIVVPR